MRFNFDWMTGYIFKPLTYQKVIDRICFLETGIAAITVPVKWLADVSCLYSCSGGRTRLYRCDTASFGIVATHEARSRLDSHPFGRSRKRKNASVDRFVCRRIVHLQCITELMLSAQAVEKAVNVVSRGGAGGARRVLQLLFRGLLAVAYILPSHGWVRAGTVVWLVLVVLTAASG